MNEELKEWLGIKPADLILYAAGAAVIGMYFNRNVALDIVLSIIAASLCVLSCVMGMRPKPGLSAFSNFVKRITYPGCLVAVLVCIYLNFARWNVHWIAEPIAGVTGLSVFDSGDWTYDRRDFQEHEDNFLNSTLPESV